MNKLGLVLTGLYCTISVLVAKAQVSQEISQEADLPLDSLLSHGTLHEAGLLRPIISLAIVIGLIYLTAFVYRRLSKFNTSRLSDNLKKVALNKFKIISSQPLGANKMLHVVEINGKYLVLGSTANSINLIKEFDKNSIEKTDKSDNETENTILPNFSEENWVSDLIEKYEDGGEDEK